MYRHALQRDRLHLSSELARMRGHATGRAGEDVGQRVSHTASAAESGVSARVRMDRLSRLAGIRKKSREGTRNSAGTGGEGARMH